MSNERTPVIASAARTSIDRFGGTRVLVTLLYALRQRGLKAGIASLCLSGREAVAMSVKMVG
jgi:hypothetical protein